MDFSPASIAYAQEQAFGEALDATYIQDGIRTAYYGDGYGLVLQILGEFNVFRPIEAVDLSLPMGWKWSTGGDGTDLTLVLSRKMP